MPTRKNFPAYKERRKQGAEARAKALAGVSPQQRLDRLNALGFVAVKERAKLAKLLDKAVEAVAETLKPAKKPKEQRKAK